MSTSGLLITAVKSCGDASRAWSAAAILTLSVRSIESQRHLLSGFVR
jgi:hypothetical protein